MAAIIAKAAGTTAATFTQMTATNTAGKTGYLTLHFTGGTTYTNVSFDAGATTHLRLSPGIIYEFPNQNAAELYLQHSGSALFFSWWYTAE